MNHAVLFAALRRLLLAAALGLAAGCSSPSAPPPLEGASIGGPFVLTDQNGRTVRDSDFAGRYRLIYFGYSFCPDVCPTDLQTIGRALDRFEKEAPDRARRVQPLFITVDPARDTPAVLKTYVAAFHPRLIGLTGSQEQIAQVKDAFGIASTRREGSSANDYLVDHSRMTFLFGPEGKPIALIPSDQGVDATLKALDTWVQ
jgi:protein SCO1/2